MKLGVPYALAAFTMWGLYPLYFQLVSAASPLEVVLHRAVWSLAFLLTVLAGLRRWAWLVQLLREPRQMLVYACSALLIGANWLVYVHAMQSHQVLQASLGYFINPLFNVALGVLVLRERLRPLQWAAVALAAGGVAWLAWRAGGMPWIALALAALFALYGLVRKTARLGALEGLAAETLLLAPLALAWLAWLLANPARPTMPAGLLAWLALSGPLTALPLLCFAAAARRLTLASLGVLQYVSPTLQFVLAVWFFNEPFDSLRLFGFALIWTALLLYSADAIRRR